MNDDQEKLVEFRVVIGEEPEHGVRFYVETEEDDS